jgi:hypothetical protein
MKNSKGFEEVPSCLRGASLRATSLSLTLFLPHISRATPGRRSLLLG